MKKLIDVMRRHLIVTVLLVFVLGVGAGFGGRYTYDHEVVYPNIAEDISKLQVECTVNGYVYRLLDEESDTLEYYYELEEMYEETRSEEYHYITTMKSE